MARKPRLNLPGAPQHIIKRGHNRGPCFFSEQDYFRYLDGLYEAATSNCAAIYVLMTNSVHILATPGTESGIAHMMQDLGRKYVRYLNHSYRRTPLDTLLYGKSIWVGKNLAQI